MTGFGFDFDVPTRNVENVPERSAAGSAAAAVDSKHGAGVLPYDVVEPPVGLGKGDPAEVKARGEHLQQKLANAGVPGGEDLAIIDDLMAVFLFQAQMAVAKGDTKTAEMLAKMAGGMVDKARNAMAGAKEGISSKGGGDSAAVRQDMARLVQTVQRIVVQARNVAGVAASAVQREDKSSHGLKTREDVEESIKQLITALHEGPDLSGIDGKGKSNIAAGKSPSVILSTEA